MCYWCPFLTTNLIIHHSKCMCPIKKRDHIYTLSLPHIKLEDRRQLNACHIPINWFFLSTSFFPASLFFLNFFHPTRIWALVELITTICVCCGFCRCGLHSTIGVRNGQVDSSHLRAMVTMGSQSGQAGQLHLFFTCLRLLGSDEYKLLQGRCGVFWQLVVVVYFL